MKYQFEDQQGIALLSWAGEALFSLGWQSPRDGSQLKIIKLFGVSKGCETCFDISMMVSLQKNCNCVNRAGVIDESPTHNRADVNPEHYQIVIQ